MDEDKNLRGAVMTFLDKTNVAALVTLFLMVMAIRFGGLDQGGQVMVLVLAVVAIVIAKRGLFHLAKGNKAYKSRDIRQRPVYVSEYQKALKAGVGYKTSVILGSILIQAGEADAGRRALEKVLSNRLIKDETLLAQAKTALSMAYYQEGDYDKAVELCEAVMAGKYRDNNLYINLGTYYLAQKRKKRFIELMNECSQVLAKVNSPALVDLVVVAQMLDGRWKEADRMYQALFEKTTFHFPDPYAHWAQVKMHYGLADEAIKLLEDSLENSNFMAVSVIPEETVTELIALLKDPATQRAIMLGNNKDPLALINRGVPKPLYDETAVFADPAELDTPLQIEMEDDGIEEEDEREMNTDLDEADEAWVRSHKDS